MYVGIGALLLIGLVVAGAVFHVHERPWYQFIMRSLKWVVLAVFVFAAAAVVYANVLAR